MQIKVSVGLALMAGLLACSPAWSAWELEGQLSLSGKGAPQLAAEAENVVLFFRPSQGDHSAPAETLEIVMKEKRFEPSLRHLPVGSTVSFPNQDPILHNVFSLTPGNEFDLGLYPEGRGEATVLRTPGLVSVYCNVHHDMIAHLWVLDTRYVAAPSQDGRFVFTDLPAGGGELVIWHERAELLQVAVEPTQTKPLLLQLELTKPKIPPHLNKEGRRYRAKRREGYN